MKKLALVFGCLIPFLATADNVYNTNPLDVYQEQCAKEKDPLKRQNSCHLLDEQNKPHAANSNFIQETITV
ncbi:MAG: hypothetical protein H0U57_04895 [Tatlockia sp.]|nr:hypothetical protein [Tatlockia sp.]